MYKLKLGIKYFVVILICICNTLVITSFAYSNSSQPFTKDTWYELNDRPVGNEELVSKFPSVIKGIGYIGVISNDVNKIVSIKDMIYMINNDGTVLEYNPSKDVWTSIDIIQDLKETEGLFRLITLNEKIYIIGKNLSDIMEYDPYKKVCVFITKLPTERRVGAAIGVDNKIYILSGAEKGNPNTTKTLDVYDLSKNEWTKKKDMFGGSNDLRVTYLNGKLYTMGVGKDFEEYDIQNDQWTMLSPSPSDLYGTGIEAVNGKIYILPTGFEAGNNIVKEYDPISNSWTGKAAMTFEVYAYATTVCNGEIYVIDNKKVVKYTVIEKAFAAENSGESEAENKIQNNDGIKVKVNDKIVDFPDAKPFIDSNSRIQIPVKFVGEALGATVSWNGVTRQVTFVNGKDKLVFTVGKQEYVKNGKVFEMDTFAVIKDNRTFVPIKYIVESLDGKVSWDSKTKTVSILKKVN